MIPPPAPATCPKCHAVLPPGAPHGLCPACLLDAAGTESEPGLAADPFAAPLDLDTLRRAFPQLEILAPLGAGGMGRVYKARQPNLDRIVALKVLPPEFARDPAWVERFTREARALARLNHPHIVQVYDVGQTTAGPGVPALCWLVMEFVDGVTLRQVQRTGGISAREALALVPKLCDALQYAHEKGVLHRDIKPENILLDAGGHVKIADFGLAKLGGPNPSPTLTMTGARLGTAAYMAPEQIESPQDVDHRADIYSLGVVFYELLTGGLPLGRFPAPSEKSGVDPRLDHIVFRTLEKERARRYQAAGDVRSALETMAQTPGTPVAPKPREVRHASPIDPTVVTPGGALPPLQQRVKVVAQKAVQFLDRHRKFPASAAEATGHGCGLMFLFLFRLALCFLPLGIPILWLEATREWNSGGIRDFYPESMLWVTAATAFASWLCVQPFLRMTKWAEAEWIKRKAGLLLLLAIVLWGGLMILVSDASQSWPTRGVAGRMTLSSDRPPLADAPEISPDASLDAMFRGVVEKEFAAAPRAILGGTGLPVRDGTDIYYYDGHPGADRNTRDHPLRKTWTVSVATESLASLEMRLMRVAEAMTAALPESVRGSITVTWVDSLYSRNALRLNLMDDETLVGLAALLMLGGWLAGFTRGRPFVHSMVPFLLAGGAVLLHLSPIPLTPGGRIVPASDTHELLPIRGRAMEALEATAASDPEAAALLRWIQACRRLDRAAVEELAARPLQDRGWEQHVSTWLDSELLAVAKTVLPASGPPGCVFKCILMPRKATVEAEWNRRLYYYHGSQRVESKTVTVTVVKEGEGLRIQQ